MPETDLSARYYLDLAAAFVRGHLSAAPDLAPEDLFLHGEEAGLRLHKFKRTMGLPRVRKVLGLLRGLRAQGACASLIDMGSGRGAFLWPLLDAFRDLPVLAVDRDARRAADLGAVSRGGVARLQAARMDLGGLGLRDGSADVVTALEVLEHLPDPDRALREIVRVARRFIVLSVPSHEDDNPEHIHRFDQAELVRRCAAAGARGLRCEAVLNHLVIVGAVG